MLVYISKGLVNVQANLTQAVIQKGKIDDRATGFLKFAISLYTRVDVANEGTPVEIVFTYDLSDEENYNADFKLLKDCFLNACRQSNISVFSNSDVVGHQRQQPRDTNTTNQIVNARYLHGEDITTASEASNAQQAAREWTTAQVGQVPVPSSTNVTVSDAFMSALDRHISNNISLPEDSDEEDYT